MFALKLTATPLLIVLATLAARRWGNSFGGWLIALPVTSGPAAYFLYLEQGRTFASQAALGMLMGTISQVALVLIYRNFASRGVAIAVITSSVTFFIATYIFHFFTLSPHLVLALVLISIALCNVGFSDTPRDAVSRARPSWWDLPMRVVVSTAMVLFVTEAASTIGSQLAGLLSPFPILAILFAVFSQRNSGVRQSHIALNGFVVGLLTPTLFFYALTQLLPSHGALAFLYASAIALVAQMISGVALQRFR